MEHGIVKDRNELLEVNPVSYTNVLIVEENITFWFDYKDTTTPVGDNVYESRFMQGRWKIFNS